MAIKRIARAVEPSRAPVIAKRTPIAGKQPPAIIKRVPFAAKRAAARIKLLKKVQRLTKPDPKIVATYPVLNDFFSIEWKGIPLRHAFGVYALCLYANFPDYIEVATDSLTEGGDDKDCDMCIVDAETGDAFIVQATAADEWNKPTASTNKADDLLTALSWLLKQPHKDIPDKLRPKAIELQEGLAKKEIKTVHLLFAHNCIESKTVRDSLDTVATSAKTLLGDQSLNVVAMEIGLPRLQHLYNSLTKQIVVDNKIKFAVQGSLAEHTKEWSAVQTTISGAALHELWQAHKEDLFSANIRGFLDMLSRRTSVNRGILETVTTEPTRFWAFNNGVTILTKEFSANQNVVEATGVSIINGAQTSGVLGNAPREHAAACRVPCRFIKCNDVRLVDQIIENNNTQNAIKAFDIRSNDVIQRRLHSEFSKVGITYLHRRQGAQRLDRTAIQAEVFAPMLAAFHGKYQIAIRQRRTIFEDRSTYGDIFQPQISAAHALLIQAMSVAINDYKTELFNAEKASAINELELAIHEFLQYSTAKLFIVCVIGRIAPQIAGRPIPNLYSWKVSASNFKSTWQDGISKRWKPVVDAVIPSIVSQIDGQPKDVVRSTAEMEKVAKKVGFQIQALKKQYDAEMSAIRDISEFA
jgi:hypothetical protein